MHVHDSYLTVIVVHEMYGLMHHNHCQITILLAHDDLSSSAYPMVTHTPAVADNLPIKSKLLGNCQQMYRELG